MRIVGIVLLVIGVTVCLVALSMTVTVDTPLGPVNNIGLMDDRRNALMLGGLVVLVGVVLTAVGSFKRPAVVDGGPAADARWAMKKCPHCAEDVRAEAVVCRYCGRDLPPSEPAIDVPPLREPPATMVVAYEKWRRMPSEKNYGAFLRAAVAAGPHLPPGATAAQLEATFPDIPVDFGDMANLLSEGRQLVGVVFDHACPNCRADTSWALVSERGFREYLLACLVCGIGPRMTGDDVLTAKELAAAHAAYGSGQLSLEDLTAQAESPAAVALHEELTAWLGSEHAVQRGWR